MRIFCDVLPLHHALCCARSVVLLMRVSFPLLPLICHQVEETSLIIFCLLAFHLVAHPWVFTPQAG